MSDRSYKKLAQTLPSRSFKLKLSSKAVLFNILWAAFRRSLKNPFNFSFSESLSY